jgi:hypothetical protein
MGPRLTTLGILTDMGGHCPATKIQARSHVAAVRRARRRPVATDRWCQKRLRRARRRPSATDLFKRTKSTPPTRSVVFANRGSGGEVECSERHVDETFGARMQPSSVGLSLHNNGRQNRSRVGIRNVADSVLETDCEPLVTIDPVETIPQSGVESSFKTPIPSRHNCSSSETKTGYTERRGMSAGFPHMIATPHFRNLSGTHVAKQA